jgi:hypothetical protein
MFSLSLQHILFIEIFPYPKLGAVEFLRIFQDVKLAVIKYML